MITIVKFTTGTAVVRNRMPGGVRGSGGDPAAYSIRCGCLVWFSEFLIKDGYLDEYESLICRSSHIDDLFCFINISRLDGNNRRQL